MTIKLVVFDIDGTILQSHSWQYIHEILGTWDRAKEYSDHFFEHQITYEEWARLDAALWKDVTLARLMDIIGQMPYTAGAKETLVRLKKRGVMIFLLSAGLSQVAQRIQQEVEVDGYAANTLVVENGVLTGKVEVNVSFYDKDKHLPHIFERFNVTENECAAVGDDATLIPVFRKVGLAIAFNPMSENIEKAAHVTIQGKDLRKILPYLLPKERTNFPSEASL